MTQESYEQLVRDLNEEMNKGNLDAIADYVLDDYAEGRDEYTVEEIIMEEKARREAFPDFHEEIQKITTNEEGDVMALYNVTGTHEGQVSNPSEKLFRNRSVVYTMPPTGKEIEFPLIRIFEVENGKITLWRSMQPPLTMLHQLGLDRKSLWEDLPDYMDDVPLPSP